MDLSKRPMPKECRRTATDMPATADWQMVRQATYA